MPISKLKGEKAHNTTPYYKLMIKLQRTIRH